jgi:hypothetical protein
MKNIYGEDNLIVWQKWFDPFGSDDSPPIIPYSDNHSEELDSSDIEDAHFRDISASQPMRAISTPMGLIPYTENTACSKIFNFWVGHTNFNLTSHVVEIIEDTDGVETLDIFTRYRFRIAIGKNFDDARVMKAINDQVYKYLGN